MKKKKILIVDDEVSFTDLLKLNLEETGRYEVKAENDGARGFEAVKVFKPDLVLIDIVMPDVTGPDVAKQIQRDETTSKIPIVFLTAMVTKDESTSKEKTIGGHHFIAKPVSPEAILREIEQYLNPES